MPDLRYIEDISNKFDAGSADLNASLQQALEDLAKDPSNPSLLAKYQALLSEYTLYRNAQTNVVKAYKDLDSSIIQNYR